MPALVSLPAMALENGLARTPPMGWSSWNSFHANIDENLIMSSADALVSSGMKDAGYVFVNIDDGWVGARDSAGNLQPDAAKFPHGLKALGDYIHSKGLQFGLYTSAGPQTCEGLPGSLGYEQADAAQFASWGVDYLKNDLCSAGNLDAHLQMDIMRDALQKTGRPIVYSMGTGATGGAFEWGAEAGNLWRTEPDIIPDFRSVLAILDGEADLASYAGPGHWNDPDMMEAGTPSLTLAESRAHFSLWCILAAPLIAGNDIRSMPAEIQSMLTNPEVIAVDQDSLGMQGRRVSQGNGAEVWVKPLIGGNLAVVMLNRSESDQAIVLHWSDLGIGGSKTAQARDLWAQNDLGEISDGFFAVIPAHDVRMLKLVPLLSLTDAIANRNNSETVRVYFSKPVDPQSAGIPAHYSLDHGVRVISATVASDPNVVVLNTSKLNGVTPYGVTVQNIFSLATPDAAPLPISSNSSVLIRRMRPVKKLRGKVFGSGKDYKKALDGKTTTVATSAGGPLLTGLQLTRKPKVLTQIRFFPAPNSDVQALLGARFETTEDGRVWQVLYTVNQAPTPGQFNSVNLFNLTPFSAVRFNSVNSGDAKGNGAMSMGEIQFFGFNAE